MLTFYFIGLETSVTIFSEQTIRNKNLESIERGFFVSYKLKTQSALSPNRFFFIHFAFVCKCKHQHNHRQIMFLQTDSAIAPQSSIKRNPRSIGEKFMRFEV